MKKKIIIAIVILIIFSIVVYIINKLGKQEEIKQSEIKDTISIFNNPIVPKGFKKVETKSASWELENGIPKGWNNGLVIEDEIGNQFVWVPVNIEEKEYHKLANNNEYYNKDNMNGSIQEEKQILKFGGFYIARFEAGISDEMQSNIKEFSTSTNNINGIPVSKKDKIPWNYISWDKAKKNTQKMYEDNVSVESDLMTYKQYNSLIYWLDKQGYNVEDSKEWGNYSNVNFRFTGYYSTDYGKTYKYGENKLKSRYNMILSTGATERNKANNIYDLVGNVMEYIEVIEHNVKNNKIQQYFVVGGYYDNISQYHIMNVYGISNKQGFRIVLYNK